MKPPLPVGHGQRLCPRGGAVAVPLPDRVSWARPHRSWGLAFSLPFWRWWKTQRRGAAADGLRPPARCRASPAAGMFWGRGLWPRPQNAAAPRMAAPILPAPPGNRSSAGGEALAKGRVGTLGCAGGRRLGCRKSGLRHFFEVFIAPLRLRRGQGAMQRNPCYARLFADLPYTPPNPIIASGGQSRAPPVAGGARRKPSEQGSARKAPRADAARLLRTALRPPNPRGFFDRLRGAGGKALGSPFWGAARPRRPPGGRCGFFRPFE